MATINTTEARLDTHEKVCAMRYEQIPGTAFQDAEAARHAIRDKYAQMQSQLDAAQSPEELKSILDTSE